MISKVLLDSQMSVCNITSAFDMPVKFSEIHLRHNRGFEMKGDISKKRKKEKKEKKTWG